MLERHLFSFFLLVLPDSTDSSRRREWMQWLSFSSFPCEKELNTTVGWLLSLSHKYTIWAFLSFRFLLLWFIVAPRYQCWQWFACGYTFLIHTVWHTNDCLSQASSSLTLSTICFVGKTEHVFSFLLHFYAVFSRLFVCLFLSFFIIILNS